MPEFWPDNFVGCYLGGKNHGKRFCDLSPWFIQTLFSRGWVTSDKVAEIFLEVLNNNKKEETRKERISDYERI